MLRGRQTGAHCSTTTHTVGPTNPFQCDAQSHKPSLRLSVCLLSLTADLLLPHKDNRSNSCLYCRRLPSLLLPKHLFRFLQQYTSFSALTVLHCCHSQSAPIVALRLHCCRAQQCVFVVHCCRLEYVIVVIIVCLDRALCSWEALGKYVNTFYSLL